MATVKRPRRAKRGIPAETSTSVGRLTEGIVNAKLGEVLRTKNPRWYNQIETESTGIFEMKASLRPDIVVLIPGSTPVIVETKFRGVPAKGGRVEAVERDAISRLDLLVSNSGTNVEQSIAVRLPDELRWVGQFQLDALFESAMLDYCVFSGTPDNHSRWPRTGWFTGNVDELATCIELVALSENRIAEGMTVLETRVDQAYNIFEYDSRIYSDMQHKIASRLHQKADKQTIRMAMAIIANALIFHASIAGHYGIMELNELYLERHNVSKHRVFKTWLYILEDVNYWPIFQIAVEVLSPIRHPIAGRILDRLATAATELSQLGATSQQDLCGRMFQRLIADRKFLATFYTLPSSAALLAELAVARIDVNWKKKSAVSSLRIADFACGTGALLSAAYGSVQRRYRRAGGDDVALHPAMMENSLVGADIMPVATHLTATALSSAHPSVPFQNTSIITLPYGRPPVEESKMLALGALDLIEKEDTTALFDTGQERVKGGAQARTETVQLLHRSFDLVIMNPPFTRPTNHESTDIPVPSFAGFETSKDEQKAMSKRLSDIRMPGMAGHGNAGLASNFVDIADIKVKSGGVIALVLPASFLQGKAWSNARSLLERRYSDITVVSVASAGSTDRAFSADTGMAEVLVVATRKDPGKQRGATLFINLEHRPRTILEATAVASAGMRIPECQESGKLRIGSDDRVGNFIRGRLSQAGVAGVKEEEVAFMASRLVDGQLRLAQRQGSENIPLNKLGSLGNRGLLDRDICGKSATGEFRGPFDIEGIKSMDIPAYPALWSHTASLERQLIVNPDSRGVPREGCRNQADRVWNLTSSRLHFNRDFRLNSQPLAACNTREPTMGGTAWPNFLCSDRCWENALALWANTTLGLIAFWWIGTRQQQGRARLTISRLPDLTVIDARQLSSEQLRLADSIFADFADREFLPANEAWRDDNRQKLDRAVLVDLLQLPEDLLEPLSLLRRQWCAEPSVHGGKRTCPPA